MDTLYGMENDTYRKQFDSYCRSVWDSAGSDPALFPDEARKKRMKEKILNRIDAQEDAERMFRKRKKRISVLLSSCAAAVILAVVTISLLLPDGRKELEYEVVADRGQKSSVTLPDGSRVWLNSASRICYSSDFNRNRRDIVLEGEAYFEVAKNEKIPFIVYASGMSVRAVGTEFNVRNYPEEGEVRATLVEGQVIASANGESASLRYGQEAVLDKSSGIMSSSQAADLNHLVPWRKSEILLSGESLEKLSGVLSRLYNVDIVFEDERIKEYTYTGLIRNNSLQNVLELISNTSPVKYEMNGDCIVFKAKYN